MRGLLIAVGVATLLFAGTQEGTGKSKAKAVQVQKEVKVTGIRQAPLNSDSQNLPSINEDTTPPMPGKVKPIPKSFVTAPPMIPHSIKDLTPIKIGDNKCLGCHMPKNAKSMKVTPIPPSHFIANFRKNKKEKKLVGARYICTTCHAPQAKVNPVVENKFQSLKSK